MFLATVLYISFYGNEYCQLLYKISYGVKRDYNEKVIDIRQLLEQLTLDWF